MKKIIILNKKKIVVNHDVIVFDFNNIILYTNDNDIENEINVFIMWTTIMKLKWIFLILQINQVHLKSMCEFTIYSKKLYKIFMILKMMKQKNDINWSIYIFIDNQVAIYSFQRFKNKIEQYILKHIVKFYRDIKREIILH